MSNELFIILLVFYSNLIFAISFEVIHIILQCICSYIYDLCLSSKLDYHCVSIENF